MTFEELCAAAAERWPGVTVEPAAIAARADASGLARDVLDTEAVAELHLALAVARGDAAAIAALDRAYLAAIPATLASMKLAAATVDDVRAIVRDKLVLADGERPPRILEYAGRGRMHGLVQVMATRTALDRARADHKLTELPARELVAPTDVELTLIKAQFRGAFSDGFARAVAALERRDRNLLRLHFLGGMTLDQLARMYDVHRATVVRWLAAARGAVLAATRDHVARTLGASTEELDEMFALVESRVELSLDRLLATIPH